MQENTNQSEIEEVRQAENMVDKMQSEITGYLVKITREQLTEPQSQLIPLLMHCTNDAERIGDHAENIIELTERLNNMERKISDDGKAELTKMWEILDDQAHNVMNALSGSDHE
ncbi:MAG: PhoU domain-containing protein, partial [Victivallaceae bacterium]